MARLVRDFTHQETIYKRRLQTITVRIRKVPASNKGHSLLTIAGAEEIEDVLRSIFEQYDDDQEHFVLLVFDGARELLGFKRLASGTRTSVMVDRALIFRNALLLGARSIMVAHNHPDGSLVPSPDDLALTKSLVELGTMMNIEVLDHIIVSPKGTCGSMKEREPLLWPPSKPDSSTA